MFLSGGAVVKSRVIISLLAFLAMSDFFSVSVIMFPGLSCELAEYSLTVNNRNDGQTYRCACLMFLHLKRMTCSMNTGQMHWERNGKDQGEQRCKHSNSDEYATRVLTLSLLRPFPLHVLSVSIFLLPLFDSKALFFLSSYLLCTPAPLLSLSCMSPSSLISWGPIILIWPHTSLYRGSGGPKYTNADWR